MYLRMRLSLWFTRESYGGWDSLKRPALQCSTTDYVKIVGADNQVCHMYPVAKTDTLRLCEIGS